MLDYHPSTRPQSAAEAANLLRPFAHPTTVPVPSDNEPVPWLPPAARLVPLPGPPVQAPVAGPARASRRPPRRPPRHRPRPERLRLGVRGSAPARANDRELTTSFRELAVMMGAGLSIPHALDLLSRTCKNAEVATGFQRALRIVSDGNSLSDGLSQAGSFPPLLVQLVAAGEQSGQLDLVLHKVASFLEHEPENVSEREERIDLPLPGVCDLHCDDSGHARAVVAGHVRLLAGPRRRPAAHHPRPHPLLRSLDGSSHLGRLAGWPRSGLEAVALPDDRRGLRSLQGPHAASTLDCRALHPVHLHRLFHAGPGDDVQQRRADPQGAVPGRASGNLWLERRIQAAAEEVAGGSSINSALKKTHFFPANLLHLIAAGEEAGNVDTMLPHVVEMAEGEVAHRLELAVAALEPAMLWFMGCCVGVIVIAALQPMLDVMSRLAT